MRKIREVLRLKSLGRNQREIASSVAAAVGTVCGRLRRAKATWERAQELSDAELDALLFPGGQRVAPAMRARIDYGNVHKELHKPGVTLQLLWSEYVEGVATRSDEVKPYQYSQYCELYGAWRSRRKPSMRRVHRAGEKAFVDYSGKKPRLVNKDTGVARNVELFVMVMGASN